MVDDEIHQNTDAAASRLGDQFIHILHCAEARVDLVVICDIVSLICKRRKVYRRNPENIDPKILQIIKFFNNSADISDSVSVRIIKLLG